MTVISDRSLNVDMRQAHYHNINIHFITGEDVRFEPDGSVREAGSSGRHSEISESSEEPQSESDTEIIMIFCWST